MKLNKMREEIANQFIAALKENQIPWRKDWTSVPVYPVNAVTDTGYKGLNALWLYLTAADKGYDDPRWCTFKQASDKGWKIKKGEKGTRIEFWSMYDTKTKKKLLAIQIKELENTLSREEFEERVKPISNVYTVFNAAQIEGIPEIVIEHNILDEKMLVEKRDKLIQNMDLKFKSGEESAFYRPSEDCIHMPDIDRFRNEYSYMATFLHEASHATGNEKRLGRNLTGAFGSPEYAKEELRAEISSVFTALTTGISPSQNEFIENHKAYIQSWISILENDPNELFRAVKEASQISDYIIEKGEFDREISVPVSEKQEEMKLEEGSKNQEKQPVQDKQPTQKKQTGKAVKKPDVSKKKGKVR